jgi:hypothetical protein
MKLKKMVRLRLLWCCVWLRTVGIHECGCKAPLQVGKERLQTVTSFDPTQSKIAALQSLDRSTSTRHSKPSVAQLQSLLSNKPPHHAQEVPISYAPKPKHEPRFIRKKLSIAHFFAPQEASDIAARRAGDHPRPKTFLHKSQHKQS